MVVSDTASTGHSAYGLGTTTKSRFASFHAAQIVHTKRKTVGRYGSTEKGGINGSGIAAPHARNSALMTDGAASIGINTRVRNEMISVKQPMLLSQGS